MLEKYEADDEWPKWDEKYLTTETVELVVQINGKLRAKIVIDKSDLEDEAKVLDLVKSDEKVAGYIKDGIKKTIFVKKANLVNLVV